LELFQETGTFKPRGALVNMLSLDDAELARGVTAASAGNHAIAVAFAASVLDTGAKIVVTGSANPERLALARFYGAELVMADSVGVAFDLVERIAEDERRAFIHPFEGELTILGTATVGLEIAQQVQGLDAVIVPVGGGGLAAGVGSAMNLLQPGCRVYGVEPEGADTMHRSFAAGRPEAIEAVRTIADSLGAPRAEPVSYAACRRSLHGLVKVTDDELKMAMALIFSELKLAVEPACAASTAALLGPLREELAGRRVALVFCGSNIDLKSFCRWAGEGKALSGLRLAGEDDQVASTPRGT